LPHPGDLAGDIHPILQGHMPRKGDPFLDGHRIGIAEIMQGIAGPGGDLIAMRPGLIRPRHSFQLTLAIEPGAVEVLLVAFSGLAMK